MKTEIERARESIKEYRKGYGQPQLPTDCIIQLMMGHAKSEQLILSGVVLQSEQLMQSCSVCGMHKHPILGANCKASNCPNEH